MRVKFKLTIPYASRKLAVYFFFADKTEQFIMKDRC